MWECGTWGRISLYVYYNKCSYFKRQRKKCIPVKYLKNPNVLKFHELMNTEDMSLLTKVATLQIHSIFFGRTNK